MKQYRISPGLSIEVPTPAAFAEVWWKSPIDEQFVRIESFINLFAEAKSQKWYESITDVNLIDGSFTIIISDPAFLRHLLSVCVVTAHDILTALSRSQHPELSALVRSSEDDVQDTDYGCRLLENNQVIASVELVDSISGVFLVVQH